MAPHLPIPLYVLTFILLTINVALAGRSVRDSDHSSPTDAKYNSPVGLHPKEGRSDLSPEDMEIGFPVTLDKVLSTMLVMPMKKNVPDNAQLYVTAQAELLRKDMQINLSLYLKKLTGNQLEWDLLGDALSYLGGFMTTPEPGTGTETTTTTLRYPMSESLKQIGAENAKAVQVVLVPKAGKGLVVIKDIKLEYI